MEENKEIVKLVKEVPQVLITVYKDLAQPGVKKVGIALETVLEFSTSFLLPLKLLNEKFKLNFEKRLNEYKEKIQNISDEDLCDVNPQIGTPIIEKLSYTTNQEISDLFTNLLAKASSIKTVNQAHPSFVQLIERLSVDEARIIKYLVGRDNIPSVTFRAYFKETDGFTEILRNKTSISRNVDLSFPENVNTYLDNLSSMGVLDNSHGLLMINTTVYDELANENNFEGLNNDLLKTGKFKEVKMLKSYYQITEFGKAFIEACTVYE